MLQESSVCWSSACRLSTLNCFISLWSLSYFRCEAGVGPLTIRAELERLITCLLYLAEYFLLSRFES